MTHVTEGGNARGTWLLDSAGRRTRLVYGNSSYTDYLYDGAGRLTVVNNNKSDDTDIAKFAYELDAAGMRTKMSISGTAYTSAEVVYGYDGAYQLVAETRTGGNAYTNGFIYDPAGNRLTRDLGETGYEYDYIDRITKDGNNTREWDYWGNMTLVNGHDYYWDDSDRMTRFDHDSGTSNDSTNHYLPGSWKRYKRVQDTTAEYFIFDGDNVLASYASDGTLNASYLTPGLDANLSMTQGENTYYYFQDGLGSVRNLIDASETVQNTYDYYAFGRSLAATENVTSPWQFTGRYKESGAISNLHFYRNRFYGPDLGQFTSRDAMWADVHRGWGYVGNAPTMYVDPYGLVYCPSGNWIGSGSMRGLAWGGGVARGEITYKCSDRMLYGVYRYYAYDCECPWEERFLGEQKVYIRAYASASEWILSGGFQGGVSIGQKYKTKVTDAYRDEMLKGIRQTTIAFSVSLVAYSLGGGTQGYRSHGWNLGLKGGVYTSWSKTTVTGEWYEKEYGASPVGLSNVDKESECIRREFVMDDSISGLDLNE